MSTPSALRGTARGTATTLRIATRKSPLALWQAHHVKAQLELKHPGLAVEIIGFTTQGDRILDTPLAKIGGKGLFVKELESALLDGGADLAVHSMKDVPLEFPPGLGLAAICARDDARDAFVANDHASLAELPAGSRVGTSSLRRQCQLRARFPSLDIVDLRGNVNTRLARLDRGDYSAILLAAAGLERLGLGARIRERLPVALSLPAAGQGALGIECRVDDEPVRALIAPLHDVPSALCVAAERAVNRGLQGGCQVPIACYAELEGEQGLYLRALVGSPDGERMLRAELRGDRTDGEALGQAVAERLLVQGADRILAALLSSH